MQVVKRNKPIKKSKVVKHRSQQQESQVVKINQMVEAVEPDYQMKAVYTGGRIVAGKANIYCSSNDYITILDPITKQVVNTIVHDNEQIANFSINNSETMIATFTNNYLLRLINIKTKQQISCIKITKFFVFDMAFSPNDKFLAIGCVNSFVKIYTVSTWKETHSYRNHKFTVKRIEWHPDPDKLQVISLDEEGNLNIFDYLLNKIIYSASDFGKNLILTKKGTNIISCDQEIKVWEYKTRKLQYAIPIGEDIETLSCFESENQGQNVNLYGKTSVVLLFGGEKLGLRMTNLSDPQHLVHNIEQLVDGGIAKIMALKASKTLLLVSTQQNISVVNYQKHFILENTVLGYNDQIIDLKFSKSTKQGQFDLDKELIVMATNSSLLKIIDLKTKNAHLISGHKDIILTVDYCHPYIISAGKDKLIKLWKIDQNTDKKVNHIVNYKGHSEDVTCIALGIATKQIISTSEDKTIKVWNLVEQSAKDIKTSLHTAMAHEKSINSIKYNHNQQLIASCSQDRTIKIWDTQLALKAVLTGHRRSVWDVSFNKIQKILASVAADGCVKLWNLVNYQCISTMGEGQALLRVTWLLHNQVITASVDGIIKIWDIRKLTSVAFDKHEGKIWALDVSPANNEGKITIATGANDSKFLLWKDITEQKNIERKREQQKNQKQKLLYSRLVTEKRYSEAARIAFEASLTQNFIRALHYLVQQYDEQAEEVTFQQGNIVYPEQINSSNIEKQLQELVRQLLNIDLIRLLKTIQDMNTTNKHFKLANILFYNILKQISLEKMSQLNRTYADDRKKDGIKQSLQKQTHFQQFLKRMRIYNEKHANRLDNYLKKSYWMDYLYSRSSII